LEARRDEKRGEGRETGGWRREGTLIERFPYPSFNPPAGVDHDPADALSPPAAYLAAGSSEFDVDSESTEEDDEDHDGRWRTYDADNDGLENDDNDDDDESDGEVDLNPLAALAALTRGGRRGGADGPTSTSGRVGAATGGTIVGDVTLERGWTTVADSLAEWEMFVADLEDFRVPVTAIVSGRGLTETWDNIGDALASRGGVSESGVDLDELRRVLQAFGVLPRDSNSGVNSSGGGAGGWSEDELRRLLGSAGGRDDDDDDDEDPSALERSMRYVEASVEGDLDEWTLWFAVQDWFAPTGEGAASRRDRLHALSFELDGMLGLYCLKAYEGGCQDLLRDVVVTFESRADAERFADNASAYFPDLAARVVEMDAESAVLTAAGLNAHLHVETTGSVLMPPRRAVLSTDLERGCALARGRWPGVLGEDGLVDARLPAPARPVPPRGVEVFDLSSYSAGSTLSAMGLSKSTLRRHRRAILREWKEDRGDGEDRGEQGEQEDRDDVDQDASSDDDGDDDDDDEASDPTESFFQGMFEAEGRDGDLYLLHYGTGVVRVWGEPRSWRPSFPCEEGAGAPDRRVGDAPVASLLPSDAIRDGPVALRPDNEVDDDETLEVAGADDFNDSREGSDSVPPPEFTLLEGSMSEPDRDRGSSVSPPRSPSPRAGRPTTPTAGAATTTTTWTLSGGAGISSTPGCKGASLQDLLRRGVVGGGMDELEARALDRWLQARSEPTEAMEDVAYAAAPATPPPPTSDHDDGKPPPPPAPAPTSVLITADGHRVEVSWGGGGGADSSERSSSDRDESSASDDEPPPRRADGPAVSLGQGLGPTTQVIAQGVVFAGPVDKWEEREVSSDEDDDDDDDDGGARLRR